MMEPMEEQSTSGKFKTIQKIISIVTPYNNHYLLNY